jgi:predicted metal-dependent peptidase
MQEVHSTVHPPENTLRSCLKGEPMPDPQADLEPNLEPNLEPPPAPNLEREVSASLLRLRMRAPFFATLALYTRFRPSLELPTAATDGLDVFYNPNFMAKLPPIQFDAVLLHEVLHAALVHVPRRGARDAKGWNIAADVVVNGILIQNGFELPEGTIRDETLEHYSVEEVYALLPRQEQQHDLSNPDLMDGPPSDADGGKSEGGPGAGQPNRPRPNEGQLSEAAKRNLEEHWKRATQQASVVARGANKGSMPAGLERLVGRVQSPQLDWRTLLWRYLVRTPTDFEEFDRRFVGRGYYLESLSGESVRVFVCVDTSGSVDDGQTQAFLNEVRGIMRAYPHVRVSLYYADASVYGPHELASDGEFPAPQGGGGTDFRPFFEAVQSRLEAHQQSVIVYLTDGFGDFPEDAPGTPTLWVVTPGGLDAEHFPFGETTPLLLD